MPSWKKLIIGSWSWKRPLYSLLCIYLFLLVVVIFFADKLIFFPPNTAYSDTLEGFDYLENENQQDVAIIYKKAATGKPTLLWSHGNAEDISTVQRTTNQLHKKGYGILVYDYPGYGLSEGSPSEKGCYANIQAAWTYLTETLNISENQIIIVGQSVGSGPSVWLAEKTKPAGLALISPFKSINRVPFGINFFPYDRFPNNNRISNVHAPLLIIHGDKDTVIKQSHGIALFDKHLGDKEFFNAQGSGHNDIFMNPEVIPKLTSFFKKLSMHSK